MYGETSAKIGVEQLDGRLYRETVLSGDFNQKIRQKFNHTKLWIFIGTKSAIFDLKDNFLDLKFSAQVLNLSSLALVYNEC